MSKFVSAAASVWDSFESVLEGGPDGDKVTLTRYGTHAGLLAVRPENGDGLTGTWAGFLVDTTELRSRPGGRGVLKVTASKDPGAPLPGSNGKVVKVRLRWVQQTNPLTSCMYGTFGSSVDVHLLTAWKHEECTDLRKEYKTAVPVRYGDDQHPWFRREVKELDAETIKIAKRMAAGQDSYASWYPVVTLVVKRERAAPVMDQLYIYTADQLATLCDRTWIPREIQGKYIKYLRAAPDMEDDGGGTLVTTQFLGSIPPGGLLEDAWGAGKAFDPDQYPEDAVPGKSSSRKKKGTGKS